MTYAESFAAEVRLALLRPGEESAAGGQAARVPPPVGEPVSQRLLIAVGDADLAGAAAALASESDELEVVERVSEPEELARALRRLDVDVVALHDALGTVPVMEIAREIAASFPEVGMVLLAAEPDARPDARGDADRHPRRRRAAAVARAARVQRPRRRAVVARAARAGLRRGDGRRRARPAT